MLRNSIAENRNCPTLWWETRTSDLSKLCQIPHTVITVAQWLRCCVTNRKVAGSIPAGVSGFLLT